MTIPTIPNCNQKFPCKTAINHWTTKLAKAYSSRAHTQNMHAWCLETGGCNQHLIDTQYNQLDICDWGDYRRINLLYTNFGGAESTSASVIKEKDCLPLERTIVKEVTRYKRAYILWDQNNCILYWKKFILPWTSITTNPLLIACQYLNIWHLPMVVSKLISMEKEKKQLY